MPAIAKSEATNDICGTKPPERYVCIYIDCVERFAVSDLSNAAIPCQLSDHILRFASALVFIVFQAKYFVYASLFSQPVKTLFQVIYDFLGDIF